MKRFGRAAVLALAVVLAGQAAEAASPKAAVRAWRAAHEKQIVTDFSALLAIPNVATTLPDVGRAWQVRINPAFSSHGSSE